MPNINDQSHYLHTIYVQNVDTGAIYDLAPQTEALTWTTQRNAAQPGTLEIILMESITSQHVEVPPGSRIRWGVNGVDYFYGLCDEPELTEDGTGHIRYRLNAVDHLFLLSMTETAYRREGLTASDFFSELLTIQNQRIQAMGGEGVQFAVREPSAARLPYYNFEPQTLYSMLKDTIDAAHMSEDAQYIIRDNLGVVEFRELQALRTPYVLGDESFAEGYTYGVRINHETYNIVKVLRANEEIGMWDAWTKFDSRNVGRWWPRQLTLEADEHMTDAQIEDKIDLHLKALNRPRRNLDLSCVGIPGLQAGDGIQVRLRRGDIDHGCWCESVSHVYTSDAHKCDLGLFFARREDADMVTQLLR